MRYSYNWLKELVDLRRFPPRRLAAKIDQTSFEIEGVERLGRAAFGDEILNIETGKTNRVDALGHWGMAAEISAILSAPLKFVPDLILPQSSPSYTKVPLHLRISPRLCQQYTAGRFQDVTVRSSPAWLAARLQNLGVKPINNIVDIANYMMLLFGQPLHVFDAAKLKGRMLSVRPAKPQEMIKTLDNETFTLNREDIVVADETGPVALAGIKGGSRAAVTRQTREIIIEAANFDPVRIRRTSWRYGLRTEAAHRFEKNLPLSFIAAALNEAARLLKKYAGAIPTETVTRINARTRPTIIRLPAHLIEAVLGYSLTNKQIQNLFRKLHFSYQRRGRRYLVTIPFYRPDLKLPEDVIEELGRLSGYEKIPEVRLPVLATSGVPPALAWREILRERLVGLGFSEAYNYSFYSREAARRFDLPEKDHFALTNPLNLEQALLRISLLPNLARAAAANTRFFDEVWMFELGNVYLQKRTAQFHDSARLALVYAGSAQPQEIFLDLKGRLQSLLKTLLVPVRYQMDEAKRSLLVLAAGIRLGEMRFCKLDKTNLALAELEFEKLLQAIPAHVVFREFSKMPVKTLDLAVVVDNATPWAKVETLVRAAPLVVDVKLFDVYRGPQIPYNRKSLAFEVVFQARERTLSDQDVQAHLQKIVKNLKTKLGASIR